MTFRIVKEKLLYVIGIPRRFASEEVLMSKAFCGKFGTPERIVINRYPKDVYEGQVAVYAHYKNPVNVAVALKVSSRFLVGSKINKSFLCHIVPQRSSARRREHSQVLLWHQQVLCQLLGQCSLRSARDQRFLPLHPLAGEAQRQSRRGR